MTIREYINRTLQEPLKRYRTPIQDAILELMTSYFETYHLGIQELPSIITPSKDRLDIVDAIAASHGFTIRPEAPLDEQLNILANIGYVYRLRGSIYSIEHMKSLYGGDLPSPAKVEIPSYGLFKYNISQYDQMDLYQDGGYNRPGTYNVWIYNYRGDIDGLIEWMYKELVTSGALIHIMNKIVSSDVMNLKDDGVLSKVHFTCEDLYNSRLYLSVTDTNGNLVALKSVDEFRYISEVPSEYAARVLKYDNPDETGLLYYIELANGDLDLYYGFSSNNTSEPDEWLSISESQIVTPTDSVLWIKASIGNSIKTTPVILKDIGVDWYIQYALKEGVLIDWVTWTEQQSLDPNYVVFTTDPSKAKGLYVRADLRGDEYPLCTYDLISIYKDPGGSSEIMRSDTYSDSGESEYTSLGTLVATKSISQVKRSKDMTDVIELILLTEEESISG